MSNPGDSQFTGRLTSWLARKALRVIAPSDFSIEVGDDVRVGRSTRARVLGLNWALRAAAVRYICKDGSEGGLDVVPTWSLRKVGEF